jgi:hypothetical protein
MIEATSTSETSINFYRTTRRYNPEDSHLHTRRRGNLKSYSLESVTNSYNLIKYNLNYQPDGCSNSRDGRTILRQEAITHYTKCNPSYELYVLPSISGVMNYLSYIWGLMTSSHFLPSVNDDAIICVAIYQWLGNSTLRSELCCQSYVRGKPFLLKELSNKLAAAFRLVRLN